MTPDGPSESASRGPSWATPALACLAALLPVWLHRAYFSGEAILYHGDAAQLQFPRYVTLCQALQRGDFPLWQTLIYGGSPFHANPENPTLYPPTLLLAAFSSPVWTINLTVLLHLGLSGLGMFLLVGRLGRRVGLPDSVRPAGALVAATIFALSHFTRRDHLNLVAYGAAHAWIPWMMLAADGLLQGEHPRRSAGWLALSIAAIGFTGGLYVIPYAYLALLVWMIFLGLLGGQEARRRALVYGSLAALAAALLVAAKLLPYEHWLPTTNRAAVQSLAEVRGTALGGDGPQIAWAEVWTRTTRFLGGFWVLLPGILSLCLLRHKTVRIVLALTLLGFAIGLGGATWRFFHDFVPPFDRVRSAVRAWTLVNAFFPVAAGLGAAWLLARPEWLRARGWLVALAGVAAAALLVSPLSSTDPREGLLWSPERLSDVRQRYPRWSEAARRAGTAWRAAFLDPADPFDRNEQFVTSLFGVETVAGYQGHVWPWRLEQHVYGAPAARLERGARLRRLGTLSVKWLVASDPAVAPTRDPGETEPPGIEGSVLLENAFARPRLVQPAVIVAILDDDLGLGARRLIDHPRFPLGEAAVISLPWSRRPEGPRASDAEIAATDFVVVDTPLNAAEEYLPLKVLLSSPDDLRVRGVHLDEAQRGRFLDQLVDDVVERARTRRSVEFGFERAGPDRCLLHVMGVDRGAGSHARFAIASEPWSWYGGWTIEGLVEPPELRLVEGISSAFLLPAEVPGSPLVAVYRPRSVRRGLALGALGLVLAVLLLLLPERRAQRGA